MRFKTTALIPTLGLLVAPLAAGAQRAGKVWRIGFVEAGSRPVNRHVLDAFRQGVAELGWVEGQDITTQDRWAEGRTERLPDPLAELARVEQPTKFELVVNLEVPTTLGLTIPPSVSLRRTR